MRPRHCPGAFPQLFCRHWNTTRIELKSDRGTGAILSCSPLEGILPALPCFFSGWTPQTESGLLQWGSRGDGVDGEDWSDPSPSLHCCCYYCSCLEDEPRLPSRAPSQTLQGNSTREPRRLKLLCRNCCLLALSKSDYELPPVQVSPEEERQLEFGLRD